MKIVQSVGSSRSLPFSLLVLSLYTKALYQKEKKHWEKNRAEKKKGTIERENCIIFWLIEKSAFFSACFITIHQDTIAERIEA